jgi:SLT domain-containing protein
MNSGYYFRIYMHLCPKLMIGKRFNVAKTKLRKKRGGDIEEFHGYRFGGFSFNRGWRRLGGYNR